MSESRRRESADKGFDARQGDLPAANRVKSKPADDPDSLHRNTAVTTIALDDSDESTDFEYLDSTLPVEDKILPWIEEESQPESDEDGGNGFEDPAPQESYSASIKSSSVRTQKWRSLQHNGVLFPPDYEPLPSHIKLYYDGHPVQLPPEAEEIATFFAKLLDTDQVKRQVFKDNFFGGFKAALRFYPPHNDDICEMDKLDFRPMADWLKGEEQRKASMPESEKARLKAEADQRAAPYQFCSVDGEKEKVHGFKIPPPGLFEGHAAHPKSGKVKLRVDPEEVDINIGPWNRPPDPPADRDWKSIQTKDSVLWLAQWPSPLTRRPAYAYISRPSSYKTVKKFDRAWKLKDSIDKLRQNYEYDLKSKIMQERQRATAIWMLDRMGLRLGHAGVCELLLSNITLKWPESIVLDFEGHAGARFLCAYEVPQQIFRNLRIFSKSPKLDDDFIFDRVTPTLVTGYLDSFMSGLTVPILQICHASLIFVLYLEKHTRHSDPMHKKLLTYEAANTRVAEMFNHTHTPSHLTPVDSVEQLQEQLKLCKYERRKLRWALMGLDEATHLDMEEESELEDEWIRKHECNLYKEMKAQAYQSYKQQCSEERSDTPKHNRQNRARSLEAELLHSLKRSEEKYHQMQEESRSGIVQTILTAEQLIEKIETKDETIAQLRSQIEGNKDNELNLDISKREYLDPRITFAWCKKYNVPVERVFKARIRKKFAWAADTSADWKY